MKKRNVCFVLLVLFICSSYATDYHDFKLDGFYYKIESREKQTVSVCAPTWNNSGYYGGDVIIPSTINYAGYDFTIIGISHGAFRNCYYINSLTLPVTLQWISQQSFENCHIEKLNILDINKWAQIQFSYYGTPAQVSDSIFVNGTSVENLTLEEGLSCINDYAFAYFKDLKSVSLPESLISIGGYAFGECNKLSVVNMPRNLTKIGKRAFYGTVIKEIVIPEGISIVEEETFWGYQSMKKITLPSTIQIIGKNAFWCSMVEEIIIYSQTPPVVEVGEINNGSLSYDGDGLSHIDKVACKIFVPESSLETYKKANYWKDFWTFMPLEGNNSRERCATPQIIYNKGKLLFTCETKGAVFHSTITDTDIRSYTIEEIILSATYNINVYATSEGYEQSDIATATLCWLESEPKMEGLGDGVVEIKSMPILIQNCNGRIAFSGIAEGISLQIYNLTGQLVGSTISNNNTTYVNTSLSKGDVAIVKIGANSVKMVLK